jgi:DNA-binding MarR family transcriptional regulator
MSELCMPGAEEQIIHQLLTAIDNDSGVSQRGLSLDIGIAVGSVNWYLKRCLSKGLIKLKHAPVKRYVYYLTPKGFEEKSRLTAEYLQRSLELFRLGRQECSEFFGDCAARGKARIFFAGDGDLAEIACLSGLSTPVRIKAVVDSFSGRPSCAGVRVFTTLPAAITATGGELPDAILLTDLSRPRRCYASIVEQAREVGLAADAIHIPRVLNFRPEITHE